MMSRRSRIRYLRAALRQARNLRLVIEVEVEDHTLGIKYPLTFEGRAAFHALITDWSFTTPLPDYPLWSEPASPDECMDWLEEHYASQYGDIDIIGRTYEVN